MHAAQAKPRDRDAMAIDVTSIEYLIQRNSISPLSGLRWPLATLQWLAVSRDLGLYVTSIESVQPEHLSSVTFPSSYVCFVCPTSHQRAGIHLTIWPQVECCFSSPILSKSELRK